MVVPIDLSETLSRFVISKRWFKPAGRFSAFLPYTGETSVFRITDISVDEIWEIGDKEVAPKRGKPILGRADIGACNITKKGLKLNPSEPPKRHAVIINWPDEESEQKVIALELAEDAEFHNRDNIC